MGIHRYAIVLTFFAWCALIGLVCAASDCGCGGLPSSSPPSGWSDAGNAAMSSYSGFGGTGGGTGAGTGTGGSSSDHGSGGGASPGSDSSSGTGQGSMDSGSSGSVSMGSSAGSYSDDALKLTSQALDLLRKGDVNASLDSLNRSLVLDPYSEKTWMVTGDVLSAMGRANESMTAYTHALQLDQADPVLYAKIGDVQLASGAYKDAVASYDHALALQPDFPSALANRTRAAGLESGLVLLSTATTPSAVPQGPVTNQSSTPAVTAAQLPAQPIATRAPLSAVLLPVSLGIAAIYSRVRRK